MRKKITVFTFLIAIVLILGIVSSIYLFSLNKEESATDEISTSSLPPVTLTFYFRGQEPKGVDEVVSELERRTKNILNANFDFKWLPANTYSSTFNGNKKNDLKWDVICSNGPRYISEGKLPMDITKLFPKYAPKYYSKFSTEELTAASVDGKLYMVPCRYPYARIYNAVIREDLRIKYGLPEISDYKGLLNYIQTVARNEKDVIPIILPNWTTSLDLFANYYGYVVLDSQLGLVYKWKDKRMKIIPWESTPEYKKALNMLNLWEKAGGNLSALDQESQVKSLIKSGEASIYSEKYACFLDSGITAEEVNRNIKTSGIKYKLYTLYKGVKTERSNITTGMEINPESPNAARILMFVEWLQSNQSNYDLLAHGILGRDYEFVGEQIKPLDSSQNSYFNWAAGGLFINLYNERTEVGESTDYLKNYIANIEENTQYPPHNGFTVNKGKLDSGLLGYRMRTNSSMEQDIARGYFTPDSIKDYIELQNQGDGIKKLAEQAQIQLDQWRLKNGLK